MSCLKDQSGQPAALEMQELKMNVCSMISGGGVRVGLEDNIWLTPKRDKFATNMDLLKRIYLISQYLQSGNRITERSEVLSRA